jgi:heme/copper-type cytochrome/quinol oxidase subunit 4
MPRARRPWPLVLAIALFAVLTLVQLAIARSALASSRDSAALIVGTLAAIAINVVLILGLVASKSWARWLTIIRILFGAVWSLYDFSETARRVGGARYLPPETSTGVYALIALGVVIVGLLLFPSVTDAMEGRWAREEE